MKKTSLLFSLFIVLSLGLSTAQAQYTIDLDFEHRQHLLFENIPCDLRIKNETGTLLKVNDPNGGADIKVRVWMCVAI